MFKKILLSLAFCLVTIVFVQAQSAKFGHINSTQLLQYMPETKLADSTLEKFGRQLESQLKSMTGEYQNKIGEYRSSAAGMAEPVKAAKEKEIADLGDRISEFQETAQESIQQKKEELYTPIIRKAEDAIKSIAKEKAYSYIFDTSAGIVLYAIESDDVMPLVKSKLGLK
ncbi:MAG TPA: OmpH family outer membrane protein [Bacteroidia bacterium]|nr:OmpH family outer membrane protein [Bacteroidia bacterium]HNT79261.1 OmpH family outer membrane protein [Bacteroidia bacterium]